MFGLLIDYSNVDGRVFKIYDTLDEAKEAMNNIACMGYRVTLFDYDKDSGEYIEFYSL